MISDEADEVIKKVLIHLKIDIKIILTWSEVMRLSSIVLLLYYKCHKINVNCGGSYIDFLN